MATTIHCDWCGERIEGAGEHPARLSPGGCTEDGRWLHAPYFHYHAVGEECCLAQAVAVLLGHAQRAGSGNPTSRPPRGVEREAHQLEEHRLDDERRHGWRLLSMDRREAFVFQFLGDDHLTIAELTKRFEAELEPDIAIYESHVRGIVTRMFNTGQLAREGEEWHSRIRYRYLRKRELEGPIVELDAMLRADGDEERAA